MLLLSRSGVALRERFQAPGLSSNLDWSQARQQLPFIALVCTHACCRHDILSQVSGPVDH
jgi:hypothetical protein